MSTHTAKLSNLFTELNNGLRAKQESPLPELLLVCKTLQILPTSYENFRSSWMLLSKDSEKGFDDLISQLCMYERNFKTGIIAEEPEALKLRECNPRQSFRSKGDDQCNYCKRRGHWVREWEVDSRRKARQNHESIREYYGSEPKQSRMF